MRSTLARLKNKMTTPTLAAGAAALPPEGALASRGGPSPLGLLLDVKGLRVAFGGKEVVHGVDFSIRPGEKLALVGESGSGKTVTALSLLGLVQNAQVVGSALFASREGEPQRDLLSLPERELLAVRGREIAMIF